MDEDVAALQKYQMELSNAKTPQEAFKASMENASDAAKRFANSHEITNDTIQKFIKQQRESQVTIMAGSKSYKNIASLINEYRGGLKNCSLTHDEFIGAINQSNTSLGKYLSSVKASKASFGGYVKSLVAGKAATIGMQAATIALNTALTMGLSFAISKLIEGFSYLVNWEEKAAEKALETAKKSREAADNVLEESDSLDSLIERYKTLANQEYKDADTRKELVEIQKEITKLVDEQSGNYDGVLESLDLVNGELATQLETLQKIQNIKFNEEVLPKLEQAYKDAGDATNKFDMLNANWYKDSVIGATDKVLGTKSLTIDTPAIKGNGERKTAVEIIDKAWTEQGYGNASEEQTNPLFGYDDFAKLTFDKDLNNKGRLDAINSAISALRSEDGFDYYNNDLYNELVRIGGEYGALVESQQKAANDLVDSLVLNQTAGSGSVDSLEEYIALRDDIINNAKNNEGVKAAIGDGIIDDKAIEVKVDNALASMGRFSEYYEKLKPELYLNDIKFNYDENIANGDEAKNWEFATWLRNLSDEEKEQVYSIYLKTDTASHSLEDWKHALETFDIVALTTIEDIESSASAALVETGALTSSIAAAQANLASQSVGKSISLADFNSEELKDYTSALEYNNGILQLNADKVNEIIEAKTEEQLAINESNKALAQSKYLENAAQIEGLRRKIVDETYAEGENKDIIQGKIDALLKENGILKDTCTSYDLMSAALREATGEYQNWLNAQNASESGDMFDSVTGAIEHINSTLNDKDSELHGRTGRKDYQAAVELMVPDSVDPDDEAAVKAYLSELNRLFTFDSDGNRTGLNLDKFCQEAVDKGLMVLDEATGDYKVAGNHTIESFAEGLNLSLPMVQSMLGELEEFDIDVSGFDDGIETLGDLAIKANESAEVLRNLSGFENYQIRLDVSDLETTDEKLAALDSTIAEMNGVKAKVAVDSSEAEQANDVIKYCITQKQLLESPLVMSVNTTALDEQNAKIIGTLQEFKLAYNELELNQALGLDTTEAENRVAELATQVQQLDTNILTELDIDPTSIDTINSTIASLTDGNKLISIGIDDSAIVGWTAETKDASVVYVVDDTAVNAYVAADKPATVFYGVDHSEVDLYNPKNLRRTVTYTLKVNGSLGSMLFGINGVNGTAHLSGTAYAGGNWGTAPGGKTLTGELGREIVVNPHTGRWFTVGDSGAEFANIPKGAIVFNHKQSEALLKYGRVAGRGKALAEGTALASGTALAGGTAMASGSGSSDDTKEIDWITIAINRLERAIKKVAKTATSAYNTLKDKIGATVDEIKLVNQEIALQQQAYNRYMQEAEAVALSGDLKEKVRNGSIDIEEYDESVQNIIKDYQEWYIFMPLYTAMYIEEFI